MFTKRHLRHESGLRSTDNEVWIGIDQAFTNDQRI